MKKYLSFFFSICMASALMAQDNSYIAGQLPEPQTIKTILSAGNPADVLLLSVSPEKLPGLAGFNMEKRGQLFPEPQRSLKVIGKIGGKGSTLSAEKIVALQPNLIIDVGNLTLNYQDQATHTFEQTGIPYLLLDGRLQASPATLRILGKILGKTEFTEPQAQYAEETLQRAAQFAKNKQPSFYLARSADGLQTGQKGSIHTEAMELVGLNNVVEGEHKGLTQVSMEQLLLWDPDVIFSQYEEFLQTIKNNPQWQNLNAVKNGKIYLIPSEPFGWLDSPPSLNRLLGMRWLMQLFDSSVNTDFASEVQRFYQLFYHIALSPEQTKALMENK